MSRTVLWILTVFLSIAMIALVGIQAYWFKNSIEAKEQQLGMVVNQVLEEISDELEQNQTLTTILEELQPPVVSLQSASVWNYRIDSRTVVAESEPEEEPKREDEPEHEGNHPVGVYRQPHHSIKNQKVKIIDDSVIVVIGQDELYEDTILVSAMKREEIRLELTRSWEEQELLVDRIVRQMMVEGNSIEELISESQIEQMLSTSFQQKGVGMPYEYAVYLEGKKPIYQSDAFNEYESCKYFRTTLIPGGIFNEPTLISVYFPLEKRHFLKSMGIIGWSSALITLFVLSLFSLALYIIFKQKRLSEMKNDFVNNMTHELKTPISTISLASQMLNDKSIPEEQKNLSQISRIIQTESKQLGFQVERVLQMAIFDHGELKLKREEINLHDLIETVAQNFLLQIDKRSGKLEFLPEAEDPVITGDSMHITNVVSNLMQNAMKYTRQTPAISIVTSNEAGRIILSVSDNGIGISKEDQKRIFDKFFRVPTGNIHNVKGFGLGLSYVKLIVEHHHGSIKIKSEPDKGSRFDIHLPLQNAQNTK
ncbi:MAG: HAMP domain-containing histidine kinase [Bacteroidetes bacterium]|nr:HAMP domain-containing histidine kinase [Bacteroidota bacterium]